MLEHEWVALGTPFRMLASLKREGEVSNRKLRLFAVACCRRIWALLSDERSRTAMEVADRLADGLADEEDQAASLIAASGAVGALREEAARAVNNVITVYDATADLSAHMRARQAANRAKAIEAAAHAAMWAIQAPYGKAHSAEVAAADCAVDAATSAALADPECRDSQLEYQGAERFSQCQLLGDIFGQSFFQGEVCSAWLSPTVLDIARNIYVARSFDRLPSLANAFQDAGCNDPNLLGHCRSDGPHVRGCWVIDLVLAKS